MIAKEIIALARDGLDDLIEPYRWKDSELARYLNASQDEAARRAYCNIQYPSLVSVTGVENISFLSTGKTITKTTGGFLTAGGLSEVNTFEMQDQITITGTVSNNGVKTIDSVTDTVITVLESLVDEPNTSAIIEDTRSATRIPLRTGVHTYKLHPQSLMVIRAKVDSLGFPLTQKTLWSLDADMAVVDYELDGGMWYSDSWETSEGSPYAFLEDNGFIKIVPPPTTEDILWLIVARLPSLRFTDSNLKLSPEIPSQYHADLVDWILHMCFMKADIDTQDLVRAKYWEDSFDKKFGPRPTAQTEFNRKKNPPNQRMRSRPFGSGG